MTRRLLTAANVGAIIAIFIVILREPDGPAWALAFAAIIVLALLGWWLVNRKKRSRSSSRR